MSQTKQLPYFTITAGDLAAWVEKQADAWWSVDGDPLLMSTVDFPCPSDELVAAIRSLGKRLRVFDGRDGTAAAGETIPPDRLDELVNVDNKSNERTFLFSWEGSDVQWLMSEDKDAKADAEQSG